MDCLGPELRDHPSTQTCNDEKMKKERKTSSPCSEDINPQC